MSQLLIDLGNTRMKLAWARGEGIDDLRMGGDYASVLAEVDQEPELVWLSGVSGPQQTQRLVAEISNRWACPVERVSVARYQQHLPTRYEVEQLGVDRWLAMLACQARCDGGFLVVDCGTAITLDLVSAAGTHTGGYILPGFGLMRDALLQATAIQVPETTAPAAGLATDTASAITRGAYASVVALIEKLLAQAEAETALFIGGGNARSLSPLVSQPHAIVEQLVLRGLARLSFLERN